MERNFDPKYYPALLFVTLWVLILFISNQMDGWATLARRFRRTFEPTGEIRSTGTLFSAAYFRYWTNYSGALHLTSADDALYLSLKFLFRIGHPPLRIPWNEIQISTTGGLFRNYIVLSLGSAERIHLRISPDIAEKIGLIERFPEAYQSFPAWAREAKMPNFDTLSDSFVESMRKKPGE